MKKLLGILVLILFTLQTPSWADDIRDFQIEGMSIGDSLLDYFSEKDIKSSVFKTTYKSKKYTKVEFYDRTKLYDGLQFYFKKNDKKYIIHVLSAHLKYEYNIEDCYKKQDEIVEELSSLFVNQEKIEYGIESLEPDEKGTWKPTNFEFSSGAAVSVTCFKLDIYNDHLKLTLYSKEYKDYVSR